MFKSVALKGNDPMCERQVCLEFIEKSNVDSVLSRRLQSIMCQFVCICAYVSEAHGEKLS